MLPNDSLSHSHRLAAGINYQLRVCGSFRACLYLILYSPPDYRCGTRRKQQRPGIAKNYKNSGTIKTTNKPTKPQPNSHRTTLQSCAPNIRRTTHISQHSTPINTQVTSHQRSMPQATHAHPRPRQSAHNNTATIIDVYGCMGCSIITPVRTNVLGYSEKQSVRYSRHPADVKVEQVYNHVGTGRGNLTLRRSRHTSPSACS